MNAGIQLSEWEDDSYSPMRSPQRNVGKDFDDLLFDEEDGLVLVTCANTITIFDQKNQKVEQHECEKCLSGNDALIPELQRVVSDYHRRLPTPDVPWEDLPRAHYFRDKSVGSSTIADAGDGLPSDVWKSTDYSPLEDPEEQNPSQDDQERRLHGSSSTVHGSGTLHESPSSDADHSTLGDSVASVAVSEGDQEIQYPLQYLHPVDAVPETTTTTRFPLPPHAWRGGVYNRKFAILPMPRFPGSGMMGLPFLVKLSENTASSDEGHNGPGDTYFAVDEDNEVPSENSSVKIFFSPYDSQVEEIEEID